MLLSPLALAAANPTQSSHSGQLLLQLLERGHTQAVHIHAGQGAKHYAVVECGGGLPCHKAFNENFPLPASITRLQGLVLAFDVRFGHDYEWGCRGKLGGMFIGEGSASAGNYLEHGSSARVMWDGPRPSNAFLPGAYGYVYVPKGTERAQPPALQPDSDTGATPFKADFAGMFTTERWHRVELGVRLNTFDSNNRPRNDGRLMLYVDGREAELGGVIWRVRPGDTFRLVRMSIFHGGGCHATRSSELRLRNLRVHEWRN